MSRPTLKIRISPEYARLQEQSARNQERNRAENTESINLRREIANQRQTEASTSVTSNSIGISGMTDTSNNSRSNGASRPATAPGLFLRDDPVGYYFKSGYIQTATLLWTAMAVENDIVVPGPRPYHFPQDAIYKGIANEQFSTGNFTYSVACGDGSQAITWEDPSIPGGPSYPPLIFNNTLDPSWNKTFPSSTFQFTREVYRGTFTEVDYDQYSDIGGIVIPAGNGACIVVATSFHNSSKIIRTDETWFAAIHYEDFNNPSLNYTQYYPSNTPLNNPDPLQQRVYGFYGDPATFDKDSVVLPPQGPGWVVEYYREPVNISTSVKYFLVTNTSVREIFPPTNSYIHTYATTLWLPNDPFTLYPYWAPNYLDFPILYDPYYFAYYWNFTSDIDAGGVRTYWLNQGDPYVFNVIFDDAVYFGVPTYCQAEDLIDPYGNYGEADALEINILCDDIYDGAMPPLGPDYDPPVYIPYQEEYDLYYSSEPYLIRKAKEKDTDPYYQMVGSQEALYGVTDPDPKNSINRATAKQTIADNTDNPDNRQLIGTVCVDWGRPNYCRDMCLKLGFTQENLTP